jgi:DNA-binding MarR family transcriptional regulator
VLTRLHRRPGASHSELAEMMEVEKATAGRMIDRLVANGWVERRTQPDDRRVKRVYLTPEAERVHKRIWRVAEDTVETALADLVGAESKQLMNFAAARQEDPGFGAATVRQKVRPASPGGIRFRAGGAGSTAGPRHDAKRMKQLALVGVPVLVLSVR